MITTSKSILIVCIAGFLISIMTSCSGGSSGGDGGGSAPEALYTGLKTPAALTQSNSQQIIEEAFHGSVVSSGVAYPFLAIDMDGRNGNVPPLITCQHSLTRMLMDALGKIPETNIPLAVSAAYTETIDEQGECGGTLSGSLQIDDESGDFTGNIDLHNFCESGIVFNGSVNIQGNIDPVTEDMSITMHFTEYSVAFEGISLFIHGTESLIESGNDISMNIDFLVRDNVSGSTSWIHGYTVLFTDYDGYVAIRISGRFYDPNYGYVVLSTSEAFIEYYGDEYPSSGVLVATGAIGSAGGTTMARLTILSSTSYMVEADTDGDGTYDWSSGEVYWE
ncbi:MAG: hypothetical protein ACP5G0_00945 [Desulfomonilia bacterium]